MTNKKFKKAAMALALTACVAATPLAANAETPENAAGAQAPAAVDHTEADTQEAPEAELPAAEEPEAQPAAEAAAQPAAPEAPPHRSGTAHRRGNSRGKGGDPCGGHPH